MDGGPRFRSKVDWWVGALLAVLPPVVALGTWSGWSAGSSPSGLLPLALVLLLYPAILFPTRYELEDDALVIRWGVMRTRVPYGEVRRVVPTRSRASGPALSMDRLRVDCSKPAGVNISPADKSGLLRALAERCPHLVLRGGALLPGDAP